MIHALHLCLIAALVLAPRCAAAQDQAASDEIVTIRQSLGLDDSVPIVLASDPKLPQAPVRLFIAAGLDTTVRDYVRKRVGEWNKKRSKKYGRIEQVDTVQAANVIVLRFQRPDEARAETRTGTQTVQVTDPNGGGSRTEVVPTIDTITLTPAYGYILVRSQSGFAVLNRYHVDKPLGEDLWELRLLWDEFEAYLGHRPSSFRRAMPW